MKKILSVSVLSIAAIALATTTVFASYGHNDNDHHDKDTSNSSIYGYVKEQGTLIPIAKAKVKLYTRGGTYKKTDNTSLRGRYTFKNLGDEQKYVIRVEAAGFRSPKDAAKTRVSYTVKADGSTKKNVYLVKI